MNENLQLAKDLLVDLIAELDVLLEDVRDERETAAAHDGVDGEPEYIRNIVREREVMMDVATMLAEVRLEWSGEPQPLGEA
jgi:hypothetical protein